MSYSIREFFLHLALNHDVMPEGESEDKLIYSASSPDEAALVYAGKVRPNQQAREKEESSGDRAGVIRI